MFYTEKLQSAIKFAQKAHENQTRKLEGEPYITHVLAVAMIVARTGADQDTIAASLLHDTIEDTSGETSVTEEHLADRFGRSVSDLVHQLTEQDKDLPWKERKRRQRVRVQQMDDNALLIKTADLIHNLTDMLAGYQKHGEEMFSKFNAGAGEQLHHFKKFNQCLGSRWPENPLLPELKRAIQVAESVWGAGVP